MLTDKDNLLRRLHALRSEHRDLDTVIARVTEQGPLDQLQVQRLKKRKLGLKDEIARLADPAFRADVGSGSPALHRIGEPMDVAGAVVFLASPAASLITGHTLLIDGGWTAR